MNRKEKAHKIKLIKSQFVFLLYYKDKKILLKIQNRRYLIRKICLFTLCTNLKFYLECALNSQKDPCQFTAAASVMRSKAIWNSNEAIGLFRNLSNGF